MTRRYWLMRAIDRPRLRGPGELSALSRRCAWCGKDPMVRCVTAAGRWARKAHRARVYPIRVVLS